MYIYLNLLFIYFVQYIKPQLARRVAWHSPIPSWRKSYASHFYSVWYAGAFELLSKESLIERFEPSHHRFVIVFSLESFCRYTVYFIGRISPTQYIIEKEIVQFVRSYYLFRALRYFSSAQVKVRDLQAYRVYRKARLLLFGFRIYPRNT